MSLATRCTSCGTVFRVVQDQLKVSEGWVRCGRCQQVFNALQCLFDLDRESPPPWAAPGTGEPDRADPSVTARSSDAPSPARSGGSQDEVEPEVQDTVADLDFARTEAPPPDDSPFSTQPLLRTQSREELAEADPPDAPSEPGDALGDRFRPAIVTPSQPAALAPAVDSRPAPFAPRMSAEAAAATPLPQLVDEPPRFIREAERAQRWDRTPVRAALGAAALVLSLLLVMQGAMHWRARTAALLPSSSPWLDAVCRWADCGPAAPRHLDQLAVTATGLVRGASAGDYRLNVALQNRAATPVLMPAIELSLTDAQGRLIARRALLPHDLSPPQPSVPAQGELTVQAALSAPGTRVVGYSVEIFYP